jgi:uncharacterized protein YlaI
MTWQTDYFMMCDICENLEHMDGRTKAQATKTAREKGWFVSATKTICPKCHDRTKRWEKAAREAGSK